MESDRASFASQTSQPPSLFQRLVHARLPTRAVGFETIHHLSRQPKRDGDLGWLFPRPARAAAFGEIGKHLGEWFRVLNVLGRPLGIVRVSRDAALNALFFRIR